jgi:hypothetical protein
VAEVRNMLDSRYDEIKSGRLKAIDGEAFFESLQQSKPASSSRGPPAHDSEI